MSEIPTGTADTGSGDEPLTHVVFELEVDDEGWPPVSGERTWAFDLGDDRYRIDNPPWFVRNIAVGDVVRAKSSGAEFLPLFEAVLEPSDHVTVRIICFRAGPLEGDLSRVIDIFTPLGASAEGAERYGIVALDIPADADLPAIQATLHHGLNDGSWEWDEGRVTAAWERARPQ